MGYYGEGALDFFVFMARVALEATRDVKTLTEIAQEFEIHPVMVGNWKKEILGHLPELFEKTCANRQRLIGSIWLIPQPALAG